MICSTSYCLYDTPVDPWHVCMCDIEDGESKYCTIGNFLSQTFMGTKETLLGLASSNN